jgi:hypothetical protein
MEHLGIYLSFVEMESSKWMNELLDKHESKQPRYSYY